MVRLERKDFFMIIRIFHNEASETQSPRLDP